MNDDLAKSHQHLVALMEATKHARDAHTRAVQDFMRPQIPEALAPEIGSPAMEFGSGSCSAVIRCTERTTASIAFTPATGLWSWRISDPYGNGDGLATARDALLAIALHLLCRAGRGAAERLMGALDVGVELVPVAATGGES